MWGRALQLALDSDMTDVLLGPGDVGAECRALGAIAATFGVSLPRFALDHGGLPTLSTRPWIAMPGPGESCATLTGVRYRSGPR
ncbi:hypothetical protein [Streptomyces chromofuscus]|uniref:Uncharacterized protein n=1 Tax=Streptomyces chromofuscus TaxID=42881 RepID=A0A7M2TA78_STRCW|nr:hypothetical protein [Streptomyces chromofuscus]QOV44855.1 hypothetical protein IPT68_02245 [Streptomyces chromofuscus]